MPPPPPSVSFFVTFFFFSRTCAADPVAHTQMLGLSESLDVWGTFYFSVHVMMAVLFVLAQIVPTKKVKDWRCCDQRKEFGYRGRGFSHGLHGVGIVRPCRIEEEGVLRQCSRGSFTLGENMRLFSCERQTDRP